jgi:hypothetical protein
MASLELKPGPALDRGRDGDTTSMPLSASHLHPNARARNFRIISRPYSGRIGGNQHFVLDGDTQEKRDLLKRVPDAAPYLEWGESLDLKPFTQIELWKQAFVEGYATCIFVFLNGWVEIMNGITTE